MDDIFLHLTGTVVGVELETQPETRHRQMGADGCTWVHMINMLVLNECGNDCVFGPLLQSRCMLCGCFIDRKPFEYFCGRTTNRGPFSV